MKKAASAAFFYTSAGISFVAKGAVKSLSTTAVFDHVSCQPMRPARNDNGYSGTSLARERPST